MVLGLLVQLVTLAQLVLLDLLVVKAPPVDLVTMDRMESLVIVECRVKQVPLDHQDDLE